MNIGSHVYVVLKKIFMNVLKLNLEVIGILDIMGFLIITCEQQKRRIILDGFHSGLAESITALDKTIFTDRYIF